MERGRYPRGVVYLNLPQQLVDVNVHPQKTEVRFADARAVADALFDIVSAELKSAFSLPTGGVSRWGSTPNVAPVEQRELSTYRHETPATRPVVVADRSMQPLGAGADTEPRGNITSSTESLSVVSSFATSSENTSETEVVSLVADEPSEVNDAFPAHNAPASMSGAPSSGR